MSEKNEQRNWDREEVVVLVAEYFRTKQYSAEIIDETYHRIREMKIAGEPVSDIFRNYSGIRMQSGRIRCLDPDTDYNEMIGTKLQKEIVDEFLNDSQKIYNESKK